jgi:sarcosine oxidase subunit gamma
MAEALSPAPSALPQDALPQLLGATSEGVAVGEIVPGSVTSVAARHGAMAAMRQATETLGLILPEPGHWSDGGSLRALWTGPGRWLVLGAARDGERLRGALSGIASLADQTDARAILSISGPRSRDVLARGIGIDLHPVAFGVGRTASTQAARIPVLLWQVEPAGFALAVARSYATSLMHWLAEAAASVGEHAA